MEKTLTELSSSCLNMKQTFEYVVDDVWPARTLLLFTYTGIVYTRTYKLVSGKN